VLSSVLSSLALGTRNRLYLTTQQAQQKKEAEAPNDHSIHSKEYTQKQLRRHGAVTAKAESFKKSQSKLSSGAVGNAALNSEWKDRAGQQDEKGNLTAGWAAGAVVLVLVLVLVPQSCASLDDLRIPFTVGVSECHPCPPFPPGRDHWPGAENPCTKDGMPARRMQAGGRACIWGRGAQYCKCKSVGECTDTHALVGFGGARQIDLG